MAQATVVEVGGEKFVLSPVTLGSLRKGDFLQSFQMLAKSHKKKVQKKVRGVPEPEMLNAMIDIIQASCPNQDITAALDKLPGLEGVEKIVEIFPQAMKLAQFTKDPRPGEAKSPVSSISPGSTESLSPQPDGPIPPSTS